MRTSFLVLRSLNELGGVEQETLAYIEVLKQKGFKVSLVTMEKTDWNNLERVFGHIDYLPDNEIILSPFKIKMFNLYQILLVNFSFKSFKGYDVLINTHADLIPIPSGISHVQDPGFIKNKNASAVVREYSPGLPKILYFTIFNLIHKILIKKTLLQSKVLIVNSEFSEKELKKWIKKESFIVYPPVNIKNYKSRDDGSIRENVVVSCGRFSDEKNQEIIPLIASKALDCHFYVIGSTTKRSKVVVDKIEQQIRTLKLNNLTISQNLPFEKKLELYRKAKVFLHTSPVEHFGMAVVEGMASGLVPLVYRNGGVWTDVLLNGRYGLGFSSIDEAAEEINRIMDDPIICGKLGNLAIFRAQAFSKENFETRVAALLEKYDN